MHIRAGQDRRHSRWLTPAVLLPAMVIGVLAVVAVTLHRDAVNPVEETPQSGRVYLTPSGLDGRFRLVHAGASDPSPGPPQPASMVRAFGRRAPDGVALSQSVVVSVTPGEFLDTTEPEPKSLVVLGEAMTVRRDPYGRRSLAWQQTDGQTVALLTFGLTDQELTAVAESVRGGPATTATPKLPSGFVSVHDRQEPSGSIPHTAQQWQSSGRDEFGVMVAQFPGVTLDDVARQLPGGHAVGVRKVTGIFSDRDGATLSWVEAPDTLVTVFSSELDAREMKDVANRLAAIDETAWQRLSAGPGQMPPVVVRSEPSGALSDDSFFSVRPVVRSTQPPCAHAPHAGSLVVVEMEVGRELTCYEVGPPAVGPDDVAGATARMDPVTGKWHVDFTLTAQGSARFDGVARVVGGGGQLAMIVDGRLVSAPRLVAPAPATGGTVSGLDEHAAHSLVARLRG